MFKSFKFHMIFFLLFQHFHIYIHNFFFVEIRNRKLKLFFIIAIYSRFLIHTMQCELNTIHAHTPPANTSLNICERNKFSWKWAKKKWTCINEWIQHPKNENENENENERLINLVVENENPIHYFTTHC